MRLAESRTRVDEQRVVGRPGRARHGARRPSRRAGWPRPPPAPSNRCARPAGCSFGVPPAARRSQHQLGNALQRLEHAAPVQRVGAEARHAAEIQRVVQLRRVKDQLAAAGPACCTGTPSASCGRPRPGSAGSPADSAGSRGCRRTAAPGCRPRRRRRRRPGAPASGWRCSRPGPARCTAGTGSESRDAAQVDGQEVEEERPVALRGERHHPPAPGVRHPAEDVLQVGRLPRPARPVVDDLAGDLARGEVDQRHPLPSEERAQARVEFVLEILCEHRAARRRIGRRLASACSSSWKNSCTSPTDVSAPKTTSPIQRPRGVVKARSNRPAAAPGAAPRRSWRVLITSAIASVEAMIAAPSAAAAMTSTDRVKPCCAITCPAEVMSRMSRAPDSSRNPCSGAATHGSMTLIIRAAPPPAAARAARGPGSRRARPPPPAAGRRPPAPSAPCPARRAAAPPAAPPVRRS